MVWESLFTAIGASEKHCLRISGICANWRVIEARGKVEKAPATLYRGIRLISTDRTRLSDK